MSNGVDIPRLSFGTYKIDPGKVTYESMRCALEIGNRHIDAATYYGNEEDVGTAVKESGIPRDVSSAILFLASEKASYITGETLMANGGSRLLV